MSHQKVIDSLINQIKNPEANQPILADRKLKKNLTPEVGWLLMQMHSQIRVLEIVAPGSSRLSSATRHMTRAIEIIAENGQDARSFSGMKKLDYYRKLAVCAMGVDTQAPGASNRREPIEGERIVAKPTLKGYDLMFADRRLARKLAKTHKRGGTSVVLLHQARTALDVSRGQLGKIKQVMQDAHRSGEPIDKLASSELVTLARTLEEVTIPSQEKAVQHLSKIVDATREIESSLNQRILNKRLNDTTKELLGEMKQTKVTGNSGDNGERSASLSLETLNAYDEISESEKTLASLGNEAYLKRLIGD